MLCCVVLCCVVLCCVVLCSDKTLHIYMNNHVHRALLRDRKEKERQKEKTLIKKIKKIK